ncbi:MAG: hypothetical protein LBT02_03135 [Rickettsiales bacterium]|jgi:alpha/beta superfamily hydrolase|nr:hypothetical protein [Rickettsiales bacterium]
MNEMKFMIFKGFDCKLRCLVHKNQNQKAPFALVLHPELKSAKVSPMAEKTVNSLIDNGFSVVFFDFTRETNVISDTILKKQEEMNEVISVLGLILKIFNVKNSLWMFSFGDTTNVTLQISMRRPEITNYILYFPPSKQKEINFVIPCSASGLVIYEKSRETYTKNIINKLKDKNDAKISSISFDFENINKVENIDRVIFSVEEYFAEKVQSYQVKKRVIKRSIRKRRRKKEEIGEVKIFKAETIKPLDLDGI